MGALLVHGLAGGRKAIYCKVHHAAIDGVSGNDVLTAILDLNPQGREVTPPPPWQGERQPAATRLLVRSAISLAGHPLRAARVSYGLARSVPGLAGLASGVVRPRLPVVDRLLGRDAKVVLGSTGGLRAPATPFNRPVTPHRRWSFVSLPLSDVKRVKSAHVVTVNDVVMALYIGALRHWLQDHDALPDAPLVAAVPVSVRTAAQEGSGGNRVSMMMAKLPTQLADLFERLTACHQTMRGGRRTGRCRQTCCPTSRSSRFRLWPVRPRALPPGCGSWRPRRGRST